MSRPLFITKSNNFTKKSDHVYVSEDIVQNPDGSVTIKKWVSDYKSACPKTIEIHFPASGEKPWHPFFINHYIRSSYFKSDIDKNQITFVSPILWFDPFENVFYDERLVIGNKNVDIRCICATYDYVDGEESAWRRSEDCKNDKTIRISLNYEKTCEILEKLGTNNNCDFYISIVDYSQSKDNLIKKNTPLYKTVADYIKVMSFKRKAFAYENELRIFAVSDKFNQKEVFPFPLKSDDYISMIEKVTLPPLNPYKRKDARFKIYEKIQDDENLDLKTELQKILPKEKINQSRLYMK